MNSFIDWCNQNQGFAMIALTTLYVFATLFLVLTATKANSISRQNIRDLAKLEQERLRPLVEVRLESNTPLIEIRITNSGQTPAFDVRIETIPTIKAVRGGQGCYPSEKTQNPIGFISYGIGSLGAGQTESSIVGTFARVKEVYPELRFKGTVHFSSGIGIKYSSPIDLDIRYLEEIARTRRNTIHDISKHLEEIKREISHFGAGFRKLHVLTQTISESRAEEEARISEMLKELEEDHPPSQSPKNAT